VQDWCCVLFRNLCCLSSVSCTAGGTWSLEYPADISDAVSSRRCECGCIWPASSGVVLVATCFHRYVHRDGLRGGPKKKLSLASSPLEVGYLCGVKYYFINMVVDLLSECCSAVRADFCCHFFSRKSGTWVSVRV